MSAARVVARLTGEVVVLQDDNRTPGLPDIRIEYVGRPVAYVEVATDIDERYAKMWAMTARGEQDRYEPRLSRAWQVSLSGVSDRQRRRRERELVSLLESMEHVDEVYERVTDLRLLPTGNSSTVTTLLRLGVVQIGSRRLRDDETEGHVRYIPIGTSGPLEPDWPTFLAWLGSFLSSPSREDVRGKLYKTGAEERHVFIGASYSSPGEVFFALTTDHVGVLPSEPPILPSEITHVWVWNAQSLDRCLVWFPDRGWLDAQLNWATD